MNSSSSSRRIPSFQCLIPWDNNKLDAITTADNTSDTESDYETCYEYYGSNSNNGNNRGSSCTPRSLSASSSFCIDDIGAGAAINQDDDYWIGPIVDNNKSDGFNKHSTINNKMNSIPLPVSSKKRDRAFIAEKLSRLRKSASYTQIKTSAAAASSAIIRPHNNKNKNNNSSRISRISSMPHLNIISSFSSSLKSKTKSPQIITIEHYDKDAYCRENNYSEESTTSPAIIEKQQQQQQQQQQQPPFNTISDDITLVILSYLNPTELRIASAISSHFNILAHDHYLWINHCCNKWPLLDRARGNKLKALTRKLEFRNDCPLPSSFTTAHNKHSSSKSSRPLNLHLFHALSQPFPNDIDSQFFDQQQQQQLFHQYNSAQPLSTPSKSKSHHDTTMPMVSVIQFIQPVGRGDRSIQSNHPFPSFKTCRPSTTNPKQRGGFVSSLFGSLLRKSFFQSGGGRQTLKAVTTLTTRSSSTTTIRPFVSPLLSLESEDGVIEVDVTPRLVAYYEITLLETTTTTTTTDRDGDDGDGPLLARPSSSSAPPVVRPTDCIAIGLATRDFDTSVKMPGWDNFSYGYHGDDGGIFHSHGNMFRSYGPRFGVSDTVGCGIDYVNRGIFFTLNGRFLGYAWTGVVDLVKKTFYPTVGVDSHCPVAFNFGSRPFMFDLKPFVDQHSKVVSELLLDNHGYGAAATAVSGGDC